jgi:CheY-like chemotaxis protein
LVGSEESLMDKDKRPRIVVVNHDPVFIELIEEALEGADYEVLSCTAGSTAFGEVKRAKPDLIILDTWLESRDAGWTVLQNLWLDRETENIPVLILSVDRVGFEERAAQFEGKRVGVMLKPFDRNALGDAVHVLLSNGPPLASRALDSGGD